MMVYRQQKQPTKVTRGKSQEDLSWCASTFKKRPKAIGKQLKLFKEDVIYQNYLYSCYITNLSFSAHIVWKMYKGRADCENRIKELKVDFGFDNFYTQDFAATQAALNFVVIAYNIISLFKQAVLRSDKLPQLKTHFDIKSLPLWFYNQIRKTTPSPSLSNHDKTKMD